MTSMTKAAIFAALTITLAFPAIAAERTMTKGTKNYQAAKSQTEQANTAAQEQPSDVAGIEPAAGADMDAPKADGKNFKEEMRLPRKN